MPKICIDAGHGGTDSGAVGSSNGFFESHAVLDIALLLRDILSPHMDVVMTRETNDFVSLSERCRIANKNHSDIFVSIHLNSAVNTTASGFEVFTSGSANSVKLAGHVLNKHASTFTNQRNRGVKEARFYVLANTAMPAILWEGCFLSNEQEADWVANDDVRINMAKAISQGIFLYFDIDNDVQELTVEDRLVRIENHLGL